jgi:hypothetical protein
LPDIQCDTKAPKHYDSCEYSGSYEPLYRNRSKLRGINPKRLNEARRKL